MNSTQVQVAYSPLFEQWRHKGFSDEQILDALKAGGLSEEEAETQLRQYRKFRNEERSRMGFYLTAIGSFLGFVSCVLTMMDIFPELRGFMLYGLTSLGLLLIFAGLFLIFE